MWTGSVVAAAFGIAWALFGASGLPAIGQGVVRVAALVVGLVIIGRSLRLRRAAPPATASMFHSRSYWAVVAGEAVAIAAGAPALVVTGQDRYVAAWVVAVVGVHFLAFGRLISPFWYPLGAVLLAGAAVGAAVGLAGGGAGAVQATSGLVAAAALLTASGYRAWRPIAGRAH